jgi:hypothetical protein
MAIQGSFPNEYPSLLLDFANTKKLDPRITFTRASTATYYDGETVAKAEENLVTGSNGLTTNWLTSNSSSTLNSAVSPDGTTTATNLAVTTATFNAGIYTNAGITVANTTLSVYAKANTANFVGISPTSSGTACYANFNLNTGAVASSAGCTASIVSVGNGWYRCILANSTLISNGFVVIAPKNADPAGNPWVSGTPTIGDSIYLWGAQLEQRSAVTAYTVTTTQPITNYIPVLLTAQAGQARFDHNPTTGESLGLLIEEQRTNLFTYSSDFSNAAWAKTNMSVSANTNIAPDGTLTADTITSLADGNFGVNQSQVFTNATAYTASAYVKYIDNPWCRVNIANVGGAWINIQTGQVGTVLSYALSATITAVGNNWYRITVTFNGDGTSYFVGFSLSIADGSFVEPVNKSMFLWGAQLELGAFATSYIPTVASQITRSADAATMTGTNFSQWFNQNEGTIYGEALTSATSGEKRIACISGGSVGNRLLDLYYNIPNTGIAVYKSNDVSISTLGTYNGVTTKTAAVYKENDYAICTNAATVFTDTTANLSNVIPSTTLGIGNIIGGGFTNGTIKKIAYYPSRLTNTELQAITS